MKFLPTIELTGQMRTLLAHGALRLQPGQWITESGRRGRYLRTNRRTGVSYVAWERSGESWDAQARRFHRACVKGFVGKYAPAYELVKFMREAERHEADTAPALPQAA